MSLYFLFSSLYTIQTALFLFICCHTDVNKYVELWGKKEYVRCLPHNTSINRIPMIKDLSMKIKILNHLD